MGVQVPLSAPYFNRLTRQPLDPEGLVAVRFGPYLDWILTSFDAGHFQPCQKQTRSLSRRHPARLMEHTEWPEGGLFERARRRALEIANDADLRIRSPRTRFEEGVALDPKLSATRKVACAPDHFLRKPPLLPACLPLRLPIFRKRREPRGCAT